MELLSPQNRRVQNAFTTVPDPIINESFRALGTRLRTDLAAENLLRR